MSDCINLCVLVANAIVDDDFIARVGANEATHAAERCLNRIERAIAAHDGKLLIQQGFARVAHFERCDSAVLAASDMLDRIHGLPNINGLRQPVRIGLHYGQIDAASSTGEGIEIARRIAALASAEQALASDAVVTRLTAQTRHSAGTQALIDPVLRQLEWPVFAIGQRNGPGNGRLAPPAFPQLSQRLRLRHLGTLQFVEEQRPVLLLGRELGNDIVITDPRASRQHARIERQREGFTLIDESTNGTFVLLEGADERCVHHDRLVLRGPGRIGCGFSTDEIEHDVVFFDIA